MDHPLLRPLEALPVQHDGQPMVLLRDPLGYSDAVLLLPPVAYFIVSYFDGAHSVREVQNAFLRRFRQMIFSEQIETIVDQLDEALFLDNERFRSHREGMEEDFRASPVRPASHAGMSYPDDPAELRYLLSSFFEHPRGPGGFPGESDGASLAALIAPHIDFQRGGHAFAWGYRRLAEAEPADLYVLLGTGHSARERFVLTRKSFATPFGAVPTAVDLVEELAGRLPWDPFEDEWSHKAEHSLEFHVLWLAGLLGVEGYQVLPILLGSFEELMEGDGLPEEQDERIGIFCDALRATLAAAGRRVRFIASVDFAHMGARFGDDRAMTPAFLDWLEREDHESLRLLAEGDAAGFYRHLAADRNLRRLDGLSTLYVLLRVLPPVRGEVLCYDQAVDVKEHSVVSFATMAYRVE